MLSRDGLGVWSFRVELRICVLGSIFFIHAIRLRRALNELALQPHVDSSHFAQLREALGTLSVLGGETNLAHLGKGRILSSLGSGETS